jgi:ABC-type phosphate transport system permease subunit
VVRVQLVDDAEFGGTVYMGEVTREEIHELTGSEYKQRSLTVRARLRDRFLARAQQQFAEQGQDVSRLEVPAGASAEKLEQIDARIPDEVTVPIRRRLFRTGNFDLTNTHFHWVPDYAIAIEGESRPEWALLLERTEWGRFYGYPDAFRLTTDRPISETETVLTRVIAEAQSHLASLDAPVRRKLESTLEQARTRLEQERIEQTREFLGQFDLPGPRQRQKVLVEPPLGSAVDLAEADPQQMQVARVVQLWQGHQQAWKMYLRHHGPSRKRLDRAERIDDEEVTEASEALGDAELEVRQAELDTEAEFMGLAESLAEIDYRIATLRDQRNQIQYRFGRAESLLELDPDQKTALQAAAEQAVSAMDLAISQARGRSRAVWDELEEILAAAPVQEEVAQARQTVKDYVAAQTSGRRRNAELSATIGRIRSENARYALSMRTADGQEKDVILSHIVRAFAPNQLSDSFSEKLGIYASRWWEFLSADPREANSEGGVFPAIFGTVLMTLLMSVAVVPFGVLAALFLREYAKQGPIVSAIRIAINNLAGVPSIVFGVFGLAFFCTGVGSFIDGGAERINIETWAQRDWFMGIGVLVAIVLGAVVAGLFSPRRAGPSANRGKWISWMSLALWFAAAGMVIWLVVVNPYYEGFYRARGNNPTFGKGALIWASLTLALLTLPVVIVSTEEALAAVPNSMREGSYGAGASKWQTIRRIVLPRAMPGIMTGAILAMARGAGEVAPLMLVGAVKIAPELPIDGEFPFGVNRSFMHLGFHIFDLGYKSQNSEAAKPVVFTTTLLLILIIATLNLAAIWLRARLRKKFETNQF